MSNPATVQVQSTAGTVLVTVGRVDGLPLDVSDSVVLASDAGWGIDGSGVPYFETNFAVPESEHAVLTVDPAGLPVLVSGSAAGIGGESLELRAPSGRRFEHVAQPTPAREYPRQADGRAFDHTPPPVEEREYPRDADGHLFAALPPAGPERSYPRQENGRMFPGPRHSN